MKKSELEELKQKVIEYVRLMPYGGYSTTARIAYSICGDQQLSTEDLFELEDAVYALDQVNEIVIDKMEHFELVQGLPFNLDFVKLEPLKLVEGGCEKIDFSYSVGNMRKMFHGYADLRTGRVVVSHIGVSDTRDMDINIFQLSETNRLSLSKSFLKKDFDEECKKMEIEGIRIADGTSWSVSIQDADYNEYSISGTVGSMNEIPMDGARMLIKQVNKLIKSINE